MALGIVVLNYNDYKTTIKFLDMIKAPCKTARCFWCLVYHSDFSMQNLRENWRSDVVFSMLKPPQHRIITGFL